FVAGGLRPAVGEEVSGALGAARGDHVDLVAVLVALPRAKAMGRVEHGKDRVSRAVARGADRQPALRVELARLDDVALLLRLGVAGARAVAALAGDAGVGEGGRPTMAGPVVAHVEAGDVAVEALPVRGPAEVGPEERMLRCDAALLRLVVVHPLAPAADVVVDREHLPPPVREHPERV